MRKRSTPVKTLREQYAEATRRTLLDEARRLFGTRGYGDTSLDDVAIAAKATKGAVYHHFKDKQQLFAAVYEELAREVASQVIERSGADAEGKVDRAISAFLEQAVDPPKLQVLLRDGPAVLGSTRCKEIDRRYGLGLLSGLLEESANPKLLKGVGAELMAKILLATVVEGGLAIGAAAEPAAEQRKVERLLRHLFASLTARSQ
jgi:AcrR family transcriptional regulator